MYGRILIKFFIDHIRKRSIWVFLSFQPNPGFMIFQLLAISANHCFLANAI